MTMLRFSGGSRTSGYVLVTDPDAPHGMVDEGETTQCVHCQFNWVIKPGSGAHRGFCMRCNGPLCGKKSCMEECVPFEKMIELIEAKGRFWRQMERLR